MARPMVWIAAFLIGGILYGHFFGPDIHILSAVLFGTIACASAIIYFYVYKRKIALIFPAFAVIGAILFAAAMTPRDMVLEEVAARHGFVRIEGQVRDIALTRSGRQRVALRADSVRIGPAAYVHHTDVSVMVYLPEDAEVALGQHILASGYLLPLDAPRNPGGFDEQRFFRSRGIDYKMFAEGVVAFEISLTTAMHITNFGVRIAEVFDQVLPERYAGIMKAMIVGDRSGLDSDIRDAYRAIGMFHIMVVSGLHVGILTAFVERSLKFFGMGVRSRSVLTILFVVGFTILTGAGVATVRAAIMGIAFLAANMLGFESDSPTTLSIAAVALLLFQPLFLFDVGFIYSFSVVLALIAASTPIQNALERFARRSGSFFKRLLRNWYVQKYLAGTLAATMAYIPVNAFFFYEFSILSPPVNFLLMPSVAIVIVLGFLIAVIGLLGGFGVFVAGILAFPVWLLLTIYGFVINTALQLPFAVTLTGRPHPIAMAAKIAAAVLAIVVLNRANGRRVGLRLGCIAAGLAVALFAVNIAPRLSNNINITFLYVGQGDATVISRGSSALIIDGGGVFGREVGENVGAFVLVPYLNYRGISSATAIVTHNHRDHAKGIVEAMLAGRIDHLILAAANSEPDYYMYALLMYAAAREGVPVTYITAGYVIEFYGAQLYVLFPYEHQIFRGQNDNSITIMMQHGTNRILFTGDLETAAESYLAARGDDLTADILHVAHHGSFTSTAQAFLDAVNPRLAIISAGRNNMFNHPHPAVTGRLRQHGVVYLVTADVGAVVVRSDGRRLEVLGDY